jgi:hypothetical protein
MDQLLDKLEKLKGLPVLIGVGLIIANFLVQLLAYAFGATSGEPGFILFLFTDANLLLHLGVIVGLIGILLGDML